MHLSFPLRINEARFHKDFEQLSQIGATPAGGVHRPTFSDAHTEAREWFTQRASDAGLEFGIDSATNHSAALYQQGATKTILLGSHLDSVPNGGRFDGGLGVAAALEVLQTIKEAKLQLPVNLEAVDFTDEEFTYIEFLGSRAFTGQLKEENLFIRPDSIEEFSLLLEKHNIPRKSLFSCARNPDDYAGYFELHIEQGSQLENHGQQIGIVTSIVGIHLIQITFLGRADHAGTTPMDSRKDAGLGAAEFTLTISPLMLSRFPDCVLNIGKMTFFPGASNIVPERVDITVEFRSPDDQKAMELEEVIRLASNEGAIKHGLMVEHKALGSTASVQLNSAIQDVISSTARTLGLSTMACPSGAGHDAQILAGFTPTGMIFVPSQGGISHNPAEFTKWEDCVNGANVLLNSTIGWALKDV